MTSVPGFNTDIKWQGRVYHVQTENISGQQQVESLIFAGGEILAAKRTSYIDPVSPMQPAEIAAFLHHQHQVITCVIQSGFIEELHNRETIKQLERLVNLSADGTSEPPKPKKKRKKKVIKKTPTLEPPVSLMDEVFGKIEPRPARGWRPSESSTIGMVQQLAKLKEEEQKAPPKADDKELLIVGGEDDDDAEYEDSDSEEGELADVTVDASLKVFLYGKEEFYGGDNGPLRVVIKSDDNPFPIKNAEVTVKLVGSAFRPMLWKQRTGADGLAVFEVAIPPFTAGTAAFIIDAISAEGECHERFAVRKSQEF